MQTACLLRSSIMSSQFFPCLSAQSPGTAGQFDIGPMSTRKEVWGRNTTSLSWPAPHRAPLSRDTRNSQQLLAIHRHWASMGKPVPGCPPPVEVSGSVWGWNCPSLLTRARLKTTDKPQGIGAWALWNPGLVARIARDVPSDKNTLLGS